MVKSLVIVIVTRGRYDDDDNDDSMCTSENIDHVDNLLKNTGNYRLSGCSP